MTIYFLQNSESLAIKIGFTSSDPEKRMAQLQTGTVGRLKLLGCIAGETDGESGLHKEFSSHRINGEWFRPSPELVLTIEHLIQHQLPWFHCRTIRSNFSFDKLSEAWSLAFAKKPIRETEWPPFKGTEEDHLHLSGQIKKTKDAFFAAVSQKPRNALFRDRANLDNMKVLRRTFGLSMSAFKRMQGFIAAEYLAAWNEQIA